MLFKSYLKSSKKHISFCVNKSQNHTNRFGKASHFVLAIVDSFNIATLLLCSGCIILNKTKTPTLHSWV